MRQLLVVGSLVCALGFAVPTGAGERSWYLGLEGGVEWDGASGTDNGWAGFVTVGTGISSNFSLEAELGHRFTTTTTFFGGDIDVNQTSLMFNALYEAPLSKEVSLVLGAGFGGEKVTFDGFYIGHDDTEIEVAGQLKLGLSVAVSEDTDLTANYRYMTLLGDVGIDNSTLTIGVRFAL